MPVRLQPTREQVNRGLRGNSHVWLAVVLAAWARPAAPALAQMPLACGDRADVVEQLRAKFGEVPRAIGLTRGGAVIELFVSEEGSFTILLSFPNGRACLQATGDQWEELSCKPPGRGA